MLKKFRILESILMRNRPENLFVNHKNKKTLTSLLLIETL